MRARILFHIYERPYALAVLGNDSGPAPDGLRSVLNGNLPQARQALTQVKGDWDRFFLGIEVADLELLYYRPNRAKKEKALVAGVVGDTQFAPFVGRRLLDNDYWSLGSTQELQAVLDTAFPQDQGGILGPVKAVSSAVTETFGPGRELASIRHVHSLVHDQPRLWCCSSFSTAPAASDLLDLFDSRIEHTLGRQAYYFYSPQGNYERALEVSDSYADELAGNPCFEQTRAISYSALLKQGDFSHHDEWNAKLHEAARLVVWWDQAQSGDTEQSLIFMAQDPVDPAMHQLFGLNDDFPMRPYWFNNQHGSTSAQRLPFSSFESDAIVDLLDHTSGDVHARYEQELKTRFIGGGKTTLKRLDAMPKQLLTPAYLRGEIGNDPDNWELYRVLADVYFNGRQYQQTADVLVSYPPFADKEPADPVQLSHYANDWGQDLLHVGEFKAARPLLEKAAGLNTGSSGSNWSAARLALLDNDYYDAAGALGENASHYNDFFAYRELASLLFAAGRDSEGWSLIDAVLKHYRERPMWTAAMPGHRRANLSDANILSWYDGYLLKNSSGPDRNLLMLHAFEELVVDRELPPDLAGMMQSLGSAADVAVRPDGKVRYINGEPDDHKALGPSEFSQARHGKLGAGAPLPDRYVLASEALVAMRAGHYDDAVSRFDMLSQYYEFGGDGMLTYFAYAAAKTGDHVGLSAWLEKVPAEKQGFAVPLARAIFAALAGKPAEAQALLDQAYVHWSSAMGDVYPDSAYVYIDICAMLYEERGDAIYRDAALREARTVRRLEPGFAFGHAAVAYLGTDPAERIDALVDALYLDPQSRWAAKAPKEIQATARARLKSGASPFKAGKSDQEWSSLAEGFTP